jgi:cbb3-type cytochrome oxidase cytochrome c subunit
LDGRVDDEDEEDEEQELNGEDEYRASAW